MNVHNSKVLDVSGAKDKEGQNVLAWKKHNGKNQQWKIVYLDSIKAGDVKKSGLDSNFGFYRHRPFFIVSRLPMKRVIQVVGGRNLVLKTRVNGRNTQKWVFDSKTKTIKSYHYSDRSFDIQNAGRSHNLQVWKTNARWF